MTTTNSVPGMIHLEITETALVRAYIAAEKGDHDDARRCLEEARDAPSTDPETRKQIEALAPECMLPMQPVNENADVFRYKLSYQLGAGSGLRGALSALSAPDARNGLAALVRRLHGLSIAQIQGLSYAGPGPAS